MNRLLCVLSTALLLLTACDDGNIEPKQVIVSSEGRVVKMEGDISGIDKWTDGYNVALAGFSNEDDYAVILKYLSQTGDGHYNVVLSSIPDEVTSVELCAVNRLRQRVYTMQQLTSEDLAHTDTVRFDIGAVDASMFNVIQQGLFTTTCFNCHGGSTTAAAGLNLTEGNSYASLMNHPSIKVAGKNVVEPGDSANSVLHMALATDVSISNHWWVNHLDQMSNNTTRIMRVIDDWIQGGATQ